MLKEINKNIDNNAKKDLKNKIEARLEEIRKYLQNDGGDLKIREIKLEEKEVILELIGACGCCPHATETLKGGIERDLRENIDPEIIVTRAK